MHTHKFTHDYNYCCSIFKASWVYGNCCGDCQSASKLVHQVKAGFKAGQVAYQTVTYIHVYIYMYTFTMLLLCSGVEVREGGSEGGSEGVSIDSLRDW